MLHIKGERGGQTNCYKKSLSIAKKNAKSQLLLGNAATNKDLKCFLAYCMIFSSSIDVLQTGGRNLLAGSEPAEIEGSSNSTENPVLERTWHMFVRSPKP